MSHHDPKLEKIRDRQKRDLKALVHRQHVEASEQAREEGYTSQGYTEHGANEGINEDVGSKLGAMKQEILEKHHERANKLMRMKGRISVGRSRARSRGKSMGM